MSRNQGLHLETVKRYGYQVLVAITVKFGWLASVVDSLDCTPPEELLELFVLLESLTQLAFIAGVGLGVLGFSLAGVMFMIPGEEYNRRAKTLAKSTLIGVIILLSAEMVVEFLISQLGGVVCS